MFIDSCEIEIIEDNLVIYLHESINNSGDESFEDKIARFETMPKYAQKGPDWQKQRHDYITASIVSDIIGNAPSGRRNLLVEKVTCQDAGRFRGSLATQWGVCYEPLANAIYSRRNNLKIWEFGLITNDKYPCLGVSPDGITTKGLIEIKCPYSRIIDYKISKKYRDQMQLQMTVCEFDSCDFLECQFMELEEESFWTQFDQALTREHPEQGLIIEYLIHNSNCGNDEADGEIGYWYSPMDFHQDRQALLKWHEDRLEELETYYQCTYTKTHFWYLGQYAIQCVIRDLNWITNYWPKLKEFWREVEHCRTLSPDEFKQYLIEYDKRNPVRKRKLSSPTNSCL